MNKMLYHGALMSVIYVLSVINKRKPFMLSVLVVCVVMLNSECSCAECHYAESSYVRHSYTKVHNAGCHYAVTVISFSMLAITIYPLY
jgi:hypothetical protein